MRQNPAQFYTQTFGAGHFLGVCFCAPTRVRAKPARFHISAPGYTKNAPDFTIPNRDTPKTCPILDPNLRRGTFQGRMQYAPTRVHPKFGGFHIPAHGYAKNAPGFTPKPSSRGISGRMQYAPTRVRKKPARFHISQ